MITAQVTLGIVHTTGGRIDTPRCIRHLEWFLAHQSSQGCPLENYSAHLDKLTSLDAALMSGERKVLCVGWCRDAEGLCLISGSVPSSLAFAQVKPRDEADYVSDTF